MRYTLTILETHFNELKNLVHKEDGFERPAILLCGRSFTKKDMWNGEPEYRFLSREIVPIPDSEINSHDEVSLNWATVTFRKALKRASDENLAICLVHSHPPHAVQFSKVDYENEDQLFKTIYERTGNDLPHLSLVIPYGGEAFGRVCSKHLKSYPINLIRNIGERFSFHYQDKYLKCSREEFLRQQLAFGDTLNNDLSKLRVGVVGCGATGSATAHLLCRLGVGHLLLIDNDLVERSNLSRLYGATVSDADAGRYKSDVLRDYLANIGIGSRIRSIRSWVGSDECRDAIRSCDIIFGCTDDNSGRIFLNRLAYFYLIPVIDMGIVIDVKDGDEPQIQTLQARVTTLLPPHVCLLCRGTIDPGLAREEDQKRNDPHGFLRLKEEAYVTGGGNPSPAVITFTTEVATMAVNEFINRLNAFKKKPPAKHLMRFFDTGEDLRPGAKSVESCPICSNNYYWGLGDVEPFMDQTN